MDTAMVKLAHSLLSPGQEHETPRDAGPSKQEVNPMLATKNIPAIGTAGAVRNAGEAGMDTGLSSEWPVKPSQPRDNCGSPEGANPLIERALRILQTAERARLGWV